MHLLEVVIAGGVFAIASGSSLQLWSATAVRAQQLTQRDQLEQLIEQDRLQLHTLWRHSLQTQAQRVSPAPDCSATAAQLLELASSWPAKPNLRRELLLSSDGRALQIQWQAGADVGLQRHRLVTPAGLGLCSLPAASPDPTSEVDPLTNSQVVGVPG